MSIHARAIYSGTRFNNDTSISRLKKGNNLFPQNNVNLLKRRHMSIIHKGTFLNQRIGYGFVRVYMFFKMTVYLLLKLYTGTRVQIMCGFCAKQSRLSQARSYAIGQRQHVGQI